MTVAAAPFVRVTWRDNRAQLTGVAEFSDGHRIPSQGASDDGVYAAWTWRDDNLVVSNDRYGIYPLYYAQIGPDLLVSPSIPTLLSEGAPADLDVEAVAVFLRLNFFVGDDTPFAAIKAVPPAARFEWHAGRLIVEDRRPPIASVPSISRSDAVDRFLQLFNQAIERRAPQDAVTLPLSGGKDSRHILFALLRAGFKPTRVVTIRHYPPRMNQDAEIAAALAARVGVPHVILDPPPRRVPAERRKNRLTEYCSDEHVQFLPLRDYLDGRAAAVFDGIAGDTLTLSWRMPPEMVAAFGGDDAGAAVRQMLEYDAPGFERALNGLLSRAAASRFTYEIAHARLAREISRHLGGPNPANAFIFWNRTRREVGLSPFRLLAAPGRIVYAPFLDAAIFDFLTGLPLDLLIDREFQVDALRRGYPQFADIPYESQSTRARAPGFARRVALELGGMALRRSTLVRRDYVASRAARAFAKGDSALLWFLPLVVWLDQVEALSEGKLDESS